MNDVTTQVVNLGQPFTKGVYARNVWDMQLFNRRIYLGHGNSQDNAPSSNAGPIPLVYIDVATDKFATLFTLDEEQIDVFKIIDNKLYIPGHDAREDWSFSNYYIVQANSSYMKFRAVTGSTHTLDMEKFNNKLYAAVNAKVGTDISVTVEVSEDGGYNWTSATTGTGFRPSGPFGRTLIVWRDKLYCLGVLISGYNTQCMRIDMTGAKTVLQAAGMLPGWSNIYIYRILRPLLFADKLVYCGIIANNGFQWIPDNLYVATDFNASKRISLGTGVLPCDILVRGDTVYVLAHTKVSSNEYINLVFKTKDLSTWTEIFRFTSNTFARSFEEYNGSFYFGLGCNTDVLPASTGCILKVNAGVY